MTRGHSSLTHRSYNQKLWILDLDLMKGAMRGPYRFVELPDGTHWLPTGAADELAPAILEHLAAAAT